MCTQDFPKMDQFIDTKIPKLGIFVDKKSQNDQTPFPKVGRKTPGIIYGSWPTETLIMVSLSLIGFKLLNGEGFYAQGHCDLYL